MDVNKVEEQLEGISLGNANALSDRLQMDIVLGWQKSRICNLKMKYVF